MPVLSARYTLICLTVAGLALTSCSQSADGAGAASGDGNDSGDGRITVVTSTDVYGDIASTIGGDRVDVRALISGASKDPHSYEATVRDKLAVSGADLVVENGSGYDPFLRQLTESVDTPPERIISAVAVSGLKPDEDGGDGHEGTGHEQEGHNHGAFNEHVWYDLETMSALADKLADQLGQLDPEGTEEFAANAAGFTDALDQLMVELDAVVPGSEHRNVAVTEPVPLYLLQDAGLENVTPAAYTEAVEEGSGVPVSAAREMDQLLSSGGVVMLAYNRQTESAQTKLAAEAATRASVPVVSFTETLPEGMDYLSWMAANIEAMDTAVGN